MLRIFMILIFLGLFCGCSSGLSGSSQLSKNEQDAVISHIRSFIRRSKVKLTPAERAYVMTHDPIFNVSYTGYKEGALTVRWAFPRQRNLIVTRERQASFERPRGLDRPRNNGQIDSTGAAGLFRSQRRGTRPAAALISLP